MEACRAALESREDAINPVAHVPMLAPSRMATAPSSVIAWLIPIATARPVTAELLWTMAVTTVPASRPANTFCPIVMSHILTAGIVVSTPSASDIKFIPKNRVPNPMMTSP